MRSQPSATVWLVFTHNSPTVPADDDPARAIAQRERGETVPTGTHPGDHEEVVGRASDRRPGSRRTRAEATSQPGTTVAMSNRRGRQTERLGWATCRRPRSHGDPRPRGSGHTQRRTSPACDLAPNPRHEGGRSRSSRHPDVGASRLLDETRNSGPVRAGFISAAAPSIRAAPNIVAIDRRLPTSATATHLPDIPLASSRPAHC